MELRPVLTTNHISDWPVYTIVNVARATDNLLFFIGVDTDLDHEASLLYTQSLKICPTIDILVPILYDVNHWNLPIGKKFKN